MPRDKQQQILAKCLDTDVQTELEQGEHPVINWTAEQQENSRCVAYSDLGFGFGLTSGL